MTLFGKLHITSKPAQPENEADMIADARILAAVAKKMSKAEAAKLIADELREATSGMGVSQKAKSNGCFGAFVKGAAVSVLALVALLAKVLS